MRTAKTRLKKYRNSGSGSGMRESDEMSGVITGDIVCQHVNMSTCHNCQSDMTHRVPRLETGS